MGREGEGVRWWGREHTAQTEEKEGGTEKGKGEGRAELLRGGAAARGPDNLPQLPEGCQMVAGQLCFSRKIILQTLADLGLS